MQSVLYRVSYSVLLNADDSADAVQEAILRAWKAREKLRKPEYMQTWMIRILLNVCYGMRRRNRRIVDMDEIPEQTAPQDSFRELHDAIAALDRDLRIPVVLHYIEGYSVNEISGILMRPSGTIKSRLLRARKQLKQELSETMKGGM